jgi:hydroxymethylbilane synthase
MKKILRLGTRGSPLAIIQAEEVRAKIFSAHAGLRGEVEIELVPIRTSGDWKSGQKESFFAEDGGGKDLFTKEIEEALLANYVDMAVHSMKDVATLLPQETEIAALLERADPRDAFIGRTARTLDALAAGATIGTASVRRQAQILAKRPDLHVVPLRGNVETRLRKLTNGEAEATILAVAGLARLGVANRISSILPTDVMLPSAAQGAIGVQIRRDDAEARRLLAPLHVASTALCVTAERAFLQALDGSCQTPIAALAQEQKDGTLLLEGLVAKPDGSAIMRGAKAGSAEKAAELGIELGEDLKRRMPPGFFKAA